MSSTDNSNEGSNFVEFRRKLSASEVLPAAMEQLLGTLNFGGRISVVVQNGRSSSPATRRDFFGNARLDQCGQAALRRQYKAES
jgi:hypothetical protein